MVVCDESRCCSTVANLYCEVWQIVLQLKYLHQAEKTAYEENFIILLPFSMILMTIEKVVDDVNAIIIIIMMMMTM